MLNRVANKAHSELRVVNQLGAVLRIKLLNFVYAGTRLMKLDSQAVCDPTELIDEGDILRAPNGETFTVVKKVLDYHKGSPIRNNLDLINNNNAVTAIRQTVVTTAQGGVAGHSDTTLFTAVPCKVGTYTQTDNKRLDVTIQRMLLMVSCKYDVLVSDRIYFATGYEPAKVESVKRNLDGLLEITFDRDPRWL